MNCMRCGRECENQDVFCPECLEYMAQHPVKPGTVINLPKRSNRPRPARKRENTPEEQIRWLEKRLDVRGAWIAILTVALVVCAGLLVLDLFQPMTIHRFVEDVVGNLP